MAGGGQVMAGGRVSLIASLVRNCLPTPRRVPIGLPKCLRKFIESKLKMRTMRNGMQQPSIFGKEPVIFIRSPDLFS